jgi:hypothetical protein
VHAAGGLDRFFRPLSRRRPTLPRVSLGGDEAPVADDLLDPMDRIRSGRAVCAICRQPIHPAEDAFVTPDFVADESDPFWSFSDAPMHRPCFLVWEKRKAFIARYNRQARGWVNPDGSHPRMTSEGDIE